MRKHRPRSQAEIKVANTSKSNKNRFLKKKSRIFTYYKEVGGDKGGTRQRLISLENSFRYVAQI